MYRARPCSCRLLNNACLFSCNPTRQLCALLRLNRAARHEMGTIAERALREDAPASLLCCRRMSEPNVLWQNGFRIAPYTRGAARFDYHSLISVDVAQDHISYSNGHDLDNPGRPVQPCRICCSVSTTRQ